MESISINNYKINYNCVKNLTLIQVCQKLYIDIPRFCYHDSLSIAGNCRVCLVEDAKQIKPIASCSTVVLPDSIIYTNSLKVKKVREAVLEFLLINHPLDCPICDQGGECDLQDQAFVFGSDRGRFYESKRAVEDFYFSPFVKTIMNRCIHCTRRIRFAKEVTDVSLGLVGRGSSEKISFYIDNVFNSELSGNIIDLCPVGALTSKLFAFTTRPWELKSLNSVSLLDPLQSPIRVDLRGTRIMRILPRLVDGYNLNWIDDKTRFSYDVLQRQRLYYPMIKINNKFVKVSWQTCFFFIKAFFIKSFKSNMFLPIANYIGNIFDINSLIVLKDFNFHLSSVFFSTKIKKILASFNNYFINYTTLECSKFIFLVNVNLRQSLPILNAKLNNLIKTKETSIILIGYFSNFNFYVKHLSTYQLQLINVLEGFHWSSNFLFSMTQQSVIIANSNKCMQYDNRLNNFNLISNPAKNEVGLVDFPVLYGLLQSFIFSWDSDIIGFCKAKSLNKTYIGTHGGRGAASSNIIFPATSIIESNGFFVNSFGFRQKINKILPKVGDSRDINSIILALSLYFTENINLFKIIMLKIEKEKKLNFYYNFTKFSNNFVNFKSKFFSIRGFSFFTELKESIKNLSYSNYTFNLKKI